LDKSICFLDNATVKVVILINGHVFDVYENKMTSSKNGIFMAPSNGFIYDVQEKYLNILQK